MSSASSRILQVFVTALRDSNAQIVEFQGRLANVTSVVDESRSDLDGALTNLADAVGNVRRFVADSRDQTAEQLERLNNVTQNLVDNKTKLENVLHVAPNAIANGYNIYNPDSGTAVGAFALSNFSDPLSVVCSAIGAVKNATAAESSKLCAQYLGPALSLLNFNHMPMPFNAYLRKSPSPENLVYTDPNLAPGGAGGRPQPYEDLPPAVSAYTGANDVRRHRPDGVLLRGRPVRTHPTVFPPTPRPRPTPDRRSSPDPPAQAPKTLRDMLLPAEAAPAPAPPAPGGTP